MRNLLLSALVIHLNNTQINPFSNKFNVVGRIPRGNIMGMNQMYLI